MQQGRRVFYLHPRPFKLFCGLGCMLLLLLSLLGGEWCGWLLLGVSLRSALLGGHTIDHRWSSIFTWPFLAPC
jgi:hypothetical protein